MNPGMGAVVVYAKEIKHNVPIDDAAFKPKEKKWRRNAEEKSLQNNGTHK